MHWVKHENQKEFSINGKVALLRRLLGLAVRVKRTEEEASELRAFSPDVSNVSAQTATPSRNPSVSQSITNGVQSFMSFFASSAKISPMSKRLATYKENDEEDEADGELPEHNDDEGIFFHLFFVLLNHHTYGIVIEDAHFCDEASWNVLYMMSHLLANAVVFMSLRSVHSKHGAASSTNKRTSNSHALPVPNIINRTVSSPSPNGGKIIQTGSRKFSAFGMGNAPPVVEEPDKHLTLSAFHGHVPLSCVKLLENPFVIRLELKPFTLAEVKHFLCKALQCNTLPEELISSVYQVSTGSPFWCKQIANFIAERGGELFIKTTTTVDDQKVNPLHVLIICRLDHMTVEQQSVIKHASIIGEQFHAVLLDKILPPALKAHLIETIAVLVNNGLLYSEYEDSDSYKFSNHLIHQIIYDLTPPR